MRAMQDFFDKKNALAHPIDAKLPSGKVATIPTFNFESSVLRLLDYEKIIPQNMCQKNFDNDTWLQKTPIKNATRIDDFDNHEKEERNIMRELKDEVEMLTSRGVPKFDSSIKGT